MMRVAFCFAVGLTLLAVGAAQPARPTVPLEGFERVDRPMAPRLIFRTPRKLVPFGPYLSIQVNVDAQGRNIVGDAANEPSVAIDPTNPRRVSVGWRQFDDVRSNFRQAGNGFSTNGGFSWTVPPVFTPGTFRSDPVLDVNHAGVFFYNSLQGTFYTDQFASWSGGLLYLLLGPATGGDKQWITVDKTNTPSRGTQYQIWSTAGNNYGGRQFSRSFDGGVTWAEPTNLPSQPIWGTLDTDADGNLVVCGSNGGSSFYFLRSTNAKDPNSTPTFTSRAVAMGGSVAFSVPVNPAGLMGQMWIGVDRSTGATRGNLYLLQSLRRSSSNPGDVMFSRSVDSGQTWSTARRLNDDPTGQGKYHWFGTLAVAPNGRIDVCWYDTRDSANNSNSVLMFTSSSDGGVTWTANRRLSPAFTQGLGYPNQNKLGDYIQIISDNGCANIIYAATFNGEQDVYFLRVPVETAEQPVTDLLVRRGSVVSGVPTDLDRPEGSAMTFRPGFTLSPQEPPLQLELTGYSPSLAPTSMRFLLTDRVTASILIRSVEMFDVAANAWVELDVRNAARTFGTLDLSLPNPSRFVNGANAQVRARVRYRPGPFVTGSSWQALVDGAMWTVVP